MVISFSTMLYLTVVGRWCTWDKIGTTIPTCYGQRDIRCNWTASWWLYEKVTLICHSPLYFLSLLLNEIISMFCREYLIQRTLAYQIKSHLSKLFFYYVSNISLDCYGYFGMRLGAVEVCPTRFDSIGTGELMLLTFLSSSYLDYNSEFPVQQCYYALDHVIP